MYKTLNQIDRTRRQPSPPNYRYHSDVTTDFTDDTDDTDQASINHGSPHARSTRSIFCGSALCSSCCLLDRCHQCNPWFVVHTRLEFDLRFRFCFFIRIVVTIKQSELIRDSSTPIVCDTETNAITIPMIETRFPTAHAP